MSIKSWSARSENLLLFLSFIKMVGSIHLFCHIANRLTAVRLGNSQNCLPQIPKNKIYCSPRDQSIISKAITAAVLMPKSNKKKISSFKLLQSTILRNLAYLVWYTILCLVQMLFHATDCGISTFPFRCNFSKFLIIKET